jgi:RNA polymerase sigma-70 factor (ECF subfamily)
VRHHSIDRERDLAEPGGADPGPRIELKEQIGLAMTALPERYQAVLRAKYEEDLAIAEIARKWGESLKAVESLLARARGAFREAFVRVEKER